MDNPAQSEVGAFEEALALVSRSRDDFYDKWDRAERRLELLLNDLGDLLDCLERLRLVHRCSDNNVCLECRRTWPCASSVQVEAALRVFGRQSLTEEDHRQVCPTCGNPLSDVCGEIRCGICEVQVP